MDRTFEHWWTKDNEEVQCNRILPELDETKGATKPDSDVKPYPNKKTWWAKKSATKRYFEGLARDLADPNSEQARARKTRRFAGLLQCMNDAWEGKVYFHDPSHKGDKGKGKGKGKEMPTEELWTKRLVAAGLDVGPYTYRHHRPGPEI